MKTQRVLIDGSRQGGVRRQSSFLSRYARHRESGSTLKTLCVMNKKPSYSEIWLFAPPVSSRYTVNKNPVLYVPKSAVGRQLGRRETRNSRQYRLYRDYSSVLYRYCTGTVPSSWRPGDPRVPARACKHSRAGLLEPRHLLLEACSVLAAAGSI